MSATPQSVQAKIDTASAEVKAATSTYPQMVKKHGPDWTKWPTDSRWWKFLTLQGQARSEVGQLVAPTPPPPPPPPPPTGTGVVYFDGSATKLTTLVSHEVTPPATYTVGPVKWPDGTTHYFYTVQEPKVWDGCACFIRDDISLVPDQRFGKAYKIAVRTGDTNQWHGAKGGTVNGSGQMTQHRTVALETWDWFAIAVRIDAWNLSPSDIRFCDILSLGYQTSSNDQIAFTLAAGPDGKLWYAVDVNGGYANGVQGNAPGTTSIRHDPVSPVAFGKWEEFVVGVKWSTHKTGALEVHRRQPGISPWSRLYNKTNIDTELYGPIYDSAGNLIKNFAQDASNWTGVIDKMGLYFGHASQTVTTETIYASGLVTCSDLATAQAQFPA